MTSDPDTEPISRDRRQRVEPFDGRIVEAHDSEKRPGRVVGPRFRQAYKFRAGIECRIHVLRREYGLKRSRYHGERGMGRWFGWGVVARTLSKVAEAGSGR